MNRCNTLATVLLASLTASASAGGHGTSGAPVQVHGYVKKDGTYVAPHYRSAPDGNFNNNWSTEGNVNPYTGEEGKLVTPPARPSTPGQLTAPAAPPALATTAQSPAVFVPTLPGEPIMMPAAKATPSPVSPSTQSIRSRASVPSFLEVQKAKDIERAKYWASRGHNFNPAYTSAFLMDQKVKDIERAQYSIFPS